MENKELNKLKKTKKVLLILGLVFIGISVVLLIIGTILYVNNFSLIMGSPEYFDSHTGKVYTDKIPENILLAVGFATLLLIGFIIFIIVGFVLLIVQATYFAKKIKKLNKELNIKTEETKLE